MTPEEADMIARAVWDEQARREAVRQKAIFDAEMRKMDAMFAIDKRTRDKMHVAKPTPLPENDKSWWRSILGLE